MTDNIDFLQNHKDNLHLFGFWDEMYKSTAIRAIESIYKLEIRAKYHITDIILHGDNVLVKWKTRTLPPDDEDLALVVEPETPLVAIGTLNKPFGLNGFNTAEIGTVVYQKKDRYIIKLSNEKTTIEVPFYKETLSPNINFYFS